MPSPTQNFEYNRPDPGTADWHQPLNDNFDAIAADISAVASDIGVSLSPSYQQPAAGSTEWHQPLNDNFDAIAADVQQLADATGADVSASYSTPAREAADWGTTLNDNFSAIDADLAAVEAALADEFSGELVISTATDNAVNYRFVADDITRIEEPDPSGNDSIITRDDGRKEAVGWTGVNQSIDNYDVTNLWLVEDIGGGAAGVYTLDGSEISPDNFNGGNECTADGDCGDGFVCLDGFCVEGSTGGGEAGNIAGSPLDTQADIDDFFVNVKDDNHGYKVTSVSSPTADGGGSMRVNFPENEHYGAEFYRYLDDLGLREIHLRYHTYLDQNFDIENPFGDGQMGKAGIGLDGRFGNDLSDMGGADGTNGWLVNMAMWRGDAQGAGRDKWFLTPYVYHADQSGKYGDTFWVDDSAAMERGRWYQHDIYFRMQSGTSTDDGVLRIWQDGDRVMNKTDFNWAWESPHDTVEAIRGLHYYGGNWEAPGGSGDNYIYHDNIQVWDSEKRP